MLARFSAKLALLVVLLVTPAACSLTSDTNKTSDRPTPIPTNFVINTQPVSIITPTPFPTAFVQPTTAPQATALQVVTQPCTTPTGWIAYRVVAGDTLSNIARRAGTTTDQLTRGNCLSNPNDIEVGELLYTPAVVATVTPYATPACTLSPRLSITLGGLGRVIPGSSNALRSLPGRSSVSVVLGEIPGGGVFNIISGPQCADGYYWWQVNYNGTIGWTAEGQGSTYWLEPVTTTSCPLTPRLTIGGQGRVITTTPSILFSQPASTSTVLGQIPSTGVFAVLLGPQCAENNYWWQVNYNGTIGWTTEGQNMTYWLEPVSSSSCLLTPRLYVTGQGRVIPGLSNALRSQPGTGSNSTVIGQIPGGGVFSVLAGTECANGYYWWQVNYNGVVGWTAEGQGSTYWLEPVTTTSCPLTPRLTIGGQGRVITTTPSILFSQPASTSTVLGQIPSTGVFIVLAGPQCAENNYWWQVNYNGTIGWTSEGQNMTYWLESVTTTTCSPTPRLSNTLGAVGRVTPGLPNKLRSQPGLGSSSVVIGEIPGSGLFNIVGGPQCADGSYWWQVNYNGAIGWTAEGQGSTYWLEPVTPAN
jgi:LysM repeat protein